MALCHSTEGGTIVGKVVNCECGEVVRAENDAEIVRGSRPTSSATTRRWPGKLSRDDILGMAEEE